MIGCINQVFAPRKKPDRRKMYFLSIAVLSSDGVRWYSELRKMVIGEKLAFNLLHFEAFDNIAFLNVIEVFDTDTAFKVL